MLGFTKLHYDPEKTGPDVEFFTKELLAKACNIYECSHLHYPWADTHRKHLDLTTFQTPPLLKKIYNYWGKWDQTPAQGRDSLEVTLQKVMVAAKNANAVPFKVLMMKKTPKDGHFPQNVKRIRKEHSKIFAERMTHTRRVKTGDDVEPTDVDSEENKHEKH